MEKIYVQRKVEVWVEDTYKVEEINDETIEAAINYISSIIGTNKNYYLLKETKEKSAEEFNFHFINLFDYIFQN